MRSVFFFLLLLSASGLLAQSAYNHNVLPMGDGEALMANTGTGGIGSPGAVFYNPGALTMLDGTSFSLSGSAYMQFSIKASPIAKIGNTELDYEANGFQTIPTSVVLVRQKKEWRLAFSVLIPYEFNYEGPTNWTVPLNNQDINLRLIQNYREKIFFAGLTAARKLGNGWSFGMTMNLQTYDLLSFTDLSTTIVGNQSVLIRSTNRQDIKVNNLYVIAGIHRTFEKWNMGLKVDLPTVKITGTGQYYDYNFSNVNGSGEGVEINEEDIGANYEMPLSVRFGATFKPNSKWTMVADIGHAFDNRYNNYDVSNVGQEEKAKGTLRTSLGMQYQLKEKTSLHGGFAHAFAKINDSDQDFWSGFMAVKFLTAHVESSFGLFYTQEQGDEEASDGLISHQTSTFYGVFLGTNYKF